MVGGVRLIQLNLYIIYPSISIKCLYLNSLETVVWSFPIISPTYLNVLCMVDKSPLITIYLYFIYIIVLDLFFKAQIYFINLIFIGYPTFLAARHKSLISYGLIMKYR